MQNNELYILNFFEDNIPSILGKKTQISSSIGLNPNSTINPIGNKKSGWHSLETKPVGSPAIGIHIYYTIFF